MKTLMLSILMLTACDRYEHLNPRGIDSVILGQTCLSTCQEKLRTSPPTNGTWKFEYNDRGIQNDAIMAMSFVSAAAPMTPRTEWVASLRPALEKKFGTKGLELRDYAAVLKKIRAYTLGPLADSPAYVPAEDSVVYRPVPGVLVLVGWRVNPKDSSRGTALLDILWFGDELEGQGGGL